jgi:hypothetical protein
MKAIKSVLANRKMFRGGGLVPTGNPMQNRNQASGILSSSDSLIDAVANDALSTQGGPTLAMNQGGVARFDNGGMFSANRPGIGMGAASVDPRTGITTFGPSADPDVSYSRRAGEIAFPSTTGSVGPRGGPPSLNLGASGRDLSSSEALYESQFPYSARLSDTGLSFALPMLEEGSMWTESITGGAPSPIETAAGSIPQLLRNAARGVSQITAMGSEEVYSILTYLFEKQDNDALGYAKVREMTTMIGRQPDHADELLQIGSNLMSSGIGENMDANEFKLAVSDELYKKNFQRTSSMQGIGDEHGPGTFIPPETVVAEYGPDGKAYGPAEDISLRPFMPTVSEGLQADTDPETQLRTRMQILGADMPGFSEDLEAYSSVMGDPAAQQEFIRNLSQQKGQEYVAMLLSNVDELAGETSVPKERVVVLPDVVIKGEPEVATKDEPRSDGSSVAENLVVPEEALLSAALSGQDLRTVPVPSNSGESKKVTRETLYSALRSDGVNADEDLQNAGIDDITRRLLDMANPDSGTATTPTMEELKRDIEAALPTIEEDESMAGLHTILLGAAIAGGTSSNPWTNIANGVTQQLPNIIAYKGKMAEAKRERQMAVAKLAINQKLGLEAEGRAEIRDMRKFARDELSTMSKEKRAEALAMRTPEDYMYVQDTMVPAEIFDENAEEGQMLLIPQHTVIPLTPTEMKRAVDLGLTKNLVLHKNVDPEDLVPPSTQIDPEDLNREYNTPTSLTVFKDFYPGGEGLSYSIQIPRPYGWSKGKYKNVIMPGDVAKINNGFRTISGKLGTLYNKVDDLYQYAATEELVGPKAWRGKLGDKVSAFRGTLPFGDQLADALLGGEAQSTISRFESEGRLLLAEITPMLLGESGRTISDADRMRVAAALGYRIDRDASGRESIGDWVGGTLNSTAGIQHALNEVKNAINNRYIEMQNEYRDAMSQVDYVIPLDTALQEEVTSFTETRKTALPDFDFDATT